MKKEGPVQMRAVLMGTVFILLSILPAVSMALAENKSCEALRQSKAYHQFKLRPSSDFSKLIYLIDRFATCDVEINYNGHYFTAPFAARVARWFLATNYKKETTKEWIMRWCNTAIPAGTPIYVKFPNGKFRLAREVLTEELKDLDKTIE